MAVKKKETKKTTTTKKSTRVTIDPPDLRVAQFSLTGTAPLMIHHFSEKAHRELEARLTGEVKGRKQREDRNFEEEMEQATYHGRSTRKGPEWHGANAASFRNAMISACRVAGAVMTRAKLSLFIVADGYDTRDGTPLVKIQGERELDVRPVRLANGSVSLCARPRWNEWKMILTTRYDAKQFTLNDVANLLSIAGMQVGIGEGRHDSKNSAGMGFGSFSITEGEAKKSA